MNTVPGHNLFMFCRKLHFFVVLSKITFFGLLFIENEIEVNQRWRITTFEDDPLAGEMMRAG